jgi:hypothetical protein
VSINDQSDIVRLAIVNPKDQSLRDFALYVRRVSLYSLY